MRPTAGSRTSTTNGAGRVWWAAAKTSKRPATGKVKRGAPGELKARPHPPRARGIAMVFQSYALYPHKTAYRNIAFPLEAMGMPPPTLKERVHGGARMFGIERLLDRFPRQLSGGERQRVALARAVVRDPKVFLFDEPLSNLDAQLRAVARYELKEFQRQLGTTTIYVTHDQVEAMGLGDRIVAMKKGKARATGRAPGGRPSGLRAAGGGVAIGPTCDRRPARDHPDADRGKAGLRVCRPAAGDAVFRPRHGAGAAGWRCVEKRSRSFRPGRRPYGGAPPLIGEKRSGAASPLPPSPPPPGAVPVSLAGMACPGFSRSTCSVSTPALAATGLFTGWLYWLGDPTLA